MQTTVMLGFDMETDIGSWTPDTTSEYLFEENMTFQVDTFLYRKEYGLRWESGVRITQDGVEEFPTRHRNIVEIQGL